MSALRAVAVSGNGGPLADTALDLALAHAPGSQLAEYLAAELATLRTGVVASTQRAYEGAARHAVAFALHHGVRTWSAEAAAACVLSAGRGVPPFQARLAPSTVRRIAAAARLALHLRGEDASAWDAPIVRAALRQVERESAAPQASDALHLEDVAQMAAAVALTPVGRRMRGAVLVGYGAALRVGELAALRWEHVARDGPDMVIALRRKRHVDWQRVSVLRAMRADVCPVRALEDLARLSAELEEAATASVVGVGTRQIQNWVRALALRAGIRGRVTPHSLRHGWASDAAAAGLPLSAIQEHLGHASPRQTARYARRAALRAFY